MKALLLLALAAAAFFSLASGAPYLEATLPGGLPAGNAAAAVGLCAVAGLAVVLSARRSVCRRVSVAALFGAVLWLPVSLALADDLALNFTGARGSAWIAFTAAVAIVVLGAVLWAAAGAALALAKGRRQER